MKAGRPGVSRALLPLDVPPGCDAHLFGEHPSVLDGRCRCMTCGRCGHHSTSTHQGHYGGWCGVTKGMRESHFCCPDPAFGCELEAPANAVNEDEEHCNWCATSGEMQSFNGQLFCDEQCAKNYMAEWENGA